jgi:hypothetical protein
MAASRARQQRGEALGGQAEVVQGVLRHAKRTAEAVPGSAGEVVTLAQTRRTRSRDDVRAYFAGAAATAASALAASAFTLALLAL